MCDVQHKKKVIQVLGQVAALCGSPLLMASLLSYFEVMELNMLKIYVKICMILIVIDFLILNKFKYF